MFVETAPQLSDAIQYGRPVGTVDVDRAIRAAEHAARV